MRTAAAGASSLTEFLERLRDDGVLVRERHSERTPGEITGYAVASPDSLDATGWTALPESRRRRCRLRPVWSQPPSGAAAWAA